MKNTLNSPIVKKVFMAVTGLFLVSFIFVHLGINLSMMALDGGDAYNVASHFMATNPIIGIIEPVLAIGFLLHILYAIKLTLENRKATPEGYAVANESSSSWASRNMFALGVILVGTLAIHLMNFWVKVKFHADLDGLGLPSSTTVGGVEMENAYAMVQGTFSYWYYVLIYIAMGIALAYHVTHGFWSAFHSMGLNTSKTRCFLEAVSKWIGIFIGFGFAIIPVVHYLNQLLGWGIY
jgi:succinate dehydrogenase / fumarate reductase cytochrome b subunit